MSKRHRPCEPDQVLLMPPVLREWLPKGYLACFLLGTVRRLDLPANADVYDV